MSVPPQCAAAVAVCCQHRLLAYTLVVKDGSVAVGAMSDPAYKLTHRTLSLADARTHACTHPHTRALAHASGAVTLSSLS